MITMTPNIVRHTYDWRDDVANTVLSFIIKEFAKSTYPLYISSNSGPTIHLHWSGRRGAHNSVQIDGCQLWMDTPYHMTSREINLNDPDSLQQASKRVIEIMECGANRELNLPRDNVESGTLQAAWKSLLKSLLEAYGPFTPIYFHMNTLWVIDEYNERFIVDKEFPKPLTHQDITGLQKEFGGSAWTT